MPQTRTPSPDIDDNEVLAVVQQGKSLSAILKELVSLRKWKDQQLVIQKQQDQRLERMLTRFCEGCRNTAVRWIRHENGSTDDLPTELLHTIFRFVVPPGDLLDPTPSRGTLSSWKRSLLIKQPLAQVNRQWRAIAVSLLYEEVSFQYPLQVRAFAKSLRDNPNLCRMVKKIVVDCPVTSDMRDAIVRDLAHIITKCTVLRTLIFTDTLFVMEDALRRVALYPFPSALANAVATLSGTLHRFEQWPQGGCPRFSFPIACIASCSKLSVLAINIDHPASLEAVELPSLEELDLSQEYDVPRPGDVCQRFLSWVLPRLKRLILPMSTDIQAGVLQRWGHSIDYLEFRDHMEMAIHLHSRVPPRHPYCDYIHMCPNLRHLVFQAPDLNDFYVASSLPSHPTLAYIDIWAASPAGDMRVQFIDLRARRAIASDVGWKNIRLLDRALSSITQLPRLFPPDTPEEELPCRHTIPGLSITHTPWGVFRNDLNALYPKEDTDDSSSDSDSDSDSDFGSDSFYGLDTSDDDTTTESDGEDDPDLGGF